MVPSMITAKKTQPLGTLLTIQNKTTLCKRVFFFFFCFAILENEGQNGGSLISKNLPVAGGATHSYTSSDL